MKSGRSVAQDNFTVRGPSLCELAHPSNHGTDSSDPVKAGTILADARAVDLIPPFAGLHELVGVNAREMSRVALWPSI
jgi:hypothetical protein